MNKTKTITHASVFSGIGGPEVAAVMLGWENAFHCEINPFGRAVLDYWFPNSQSYEDITTTDFTPWRGRIDVLTGGFPCQPFSYAGKRRGAEDDRYLWPYMFRCIDQIQPAWVVCENVAGILTMVEQGEVSQVADEATLFGEDNAVHRYELRETFTLQRICGDLEQHGYEVQPVLVPACGVGAPHRRDRVFVLGRRIVANSDLRADGRRPGADAGKGREERLQERDEVRFTDQSGEVRSEGEGYAPAYTSGRGEGTPGKGGRTEGGRRSGYLFTGERRGETEWNSGFYGLLRYASDTHRGAGERECQVERELTRRDGIDGNGSRRTSPYTHCEGREKSQQPGRGTDSQEKGEGLDDRTERSGGYGDFANAICERLQRQNESGSGEARERMRVWRDTPGCNRPFDGDLAGGNRWTNFPTVSPIHRGNDGLPFDVDNLTISFAKWRTESLKAYGNAIVPQVMYEIFRVIDQYEHLH